MHGMRTSAGAAVLFVMLGACSTQPASGTIEAARNDWLRATMHNCLRKGFNEYRYVPTADLVDMCSAAVYGHRSIRQPANR